MATTTMNCTAHKENFHKFFESWIVEQNRFLQELISASKTQHHDRQTSCRDGTITNSEDDEKLQSLVGRVIQHYELYYKTKSRCAKQDVLAMFSPSWLTKLEDAFLWIGGWRSSIAFHLLYSKSGLQLESQLPHLIQGLSTGDLADLSPAQMCQVDELHRQTLRKEKELSEKLAKHQETVADSSMVELSHAVTEMLHESSNIHGYGDGIKEQIETTLLAKEEGLEEILKRADDLRLDTLKQILQILSPAQAVHFLIAAAELHLRIHEWGKKKDAAQIQISTGVQPNQSYN